MTCETILVTAISGDVGNGLLKCLGGNRRLIGCDVNQYPIGYDRVDFFQKVPYASDEENYLKALEDLIKKQGITHFVPVNEEEIKIISTNLERFNSLGVKVAIQSKEVLDLCFDKYTLAIKLRAEEIGAPESFLPEDFLEDGREYLAKLRFSSGSKMIQRFFSRKKLDELRKEIKQPLLVQRYIPSEKTEYTIGVFSDGQTINSISFRRQLKNGYSSQVELVQDDHLKALAEKVAEFLNLKGSINIQLRRHKGCDYIFEINPRLSGTAFFRHQLAFSDAVWWLDILNGKKVSVYESPYKKALGVREMNEKFIVLK